MIRTFHDIFNCALYISVTGIIIWVTQYTLTAPWWRNVIGITLIGFALVDLGIFLPPALALADPSGFSRYGEDTWYLVMITGVVVASAVFIVTRIVLWERLRRHPGRLPVDMMKRIAELEAENAALRQALDRT